MLQDVNYLALLVTLSYLISLICVFRILLSYRTAQGAMAWIVALLTIPVVALLFYALFGRNRLDGYVKARRSGDVELAHLVSDVQRRQAEQYLCDPPGDGSELGVLSELVRLPFTRYNHCRLLQDGEATFRALFDALHEARDYILLEFYLVRSDRIGKQVKSTLLRKLYEGVRVYFIYDEIGSVGLPRDYIDELEQAGARVFAFGNPTRRRRQFELNFRNHRKLLVCDGKVGFVGGLNLGDEYLGSSGGVLDSPQAMPWRDTHCRVEGPAVLALQLTFVEDYYWASNQVPRLDWRGYRASEGDQRVLMLPTGPADEFETCALFFLNGINSARTRIWIASPYFVPDLQIVNALQLAALRGVDVRVILPRSTDNRLVWFAAYSYLVQADRAGISIYHYLPGFMHQKVLIVDDRYAAVGTANLDNRSMRLNFELTAVVASADFVADVDRMLRADLAHCERLTAAHYQDRSLLFKVASRAARLAAPLL